MRTTVVVLRNFAFMNRLFLVCLSALLMACGSEPEVSTKDLCSNVTIEEASPLSTTLKPFTSQLEQKTGVEVLEDGGGAMISRAWFTKAAERTIDIQYFIFSTDNVGLIACDYIVRAADRGVKVRIIVDDLLVDAEIDDILTMDRHENIDIKIYNPGVNLGKNIIGKIAEFATDFKSANKRMHNKTFIVDGKIAITGGRNLADEYFDYDHEYNFRDRDVLLLGQVVPQLQSSFNQYWDSEYSVPIAEIQKPEDTPMEQLYYGLHQYACNPENFWPEVRTKVNGYEASLTDKLKGNGITWLDSVVFVSDEPGKNEEDDGLGGGGITTETLIALVNGAKETVDIQTPYLVTSELGKNLMKEAVKRGVRVRILTNSLASTDNLEAFSGYQRDRGELLETGIRIFEYKPDAAIRKEVMTGALQKAVDFTPIFGLHAKSMVVDGRIAVVGTFNLDPRSANLNTECLAIIHSAEVAQGMLKEMEKEFQPENAWETTIDFNPDSVVSIKRRVDSWTRKVVPKGIL